MIVVTGAEGFIGSSLVARLNKDNFNDLILVDDFGALEGRAQNLDNKIYTAKVERRDFQTWFKANSHHVQFVFHIGARTDTTDPDEKIFKELNLDFSIALYEECCNEGVPFVYASSAATYGDGRFGYDDQCDLNILNPLNPYARSKHDFDKYVLANERKPSFWAGLKFFNVYGPNEYHKGRMASVILHSYYQIRETGKVKLFKSHKPEYKNGEQMRDFIYVKDLCDVCMFTLHHRENSGIYNLGSGKARTWNDLAISLFKVMKLPVNIEYIDIPRDIQESYQYYTEAKMAKLRKIGYSREFTSLEDGVANYVENYLQDNQYL